MRLIISMLLVVMSCAAFAQSSKKKKKSSAEATQQGGPTTLDPSYPQEQAYGPKKTSRKSSAKGPTYNLEQAYYERVEEVAKTRRKNERLMEKPQYADPSYFGHKRPPKKRPPHKMKFCKECGIRH